AKYIQPSVAADQSQEVRPPAEMEEHGGSIGSPTLSTRRNTAPSSLPAIRSQAPASSKWKFILISSVTAKRRNHAQADFLSFSSGVINHHCVRTAVRSHARRRTDHRSRNRRGCRAQRRHPRRKDCPRLVRGAERP